MQKRIACQRYGGEGVPKKFRKYVVPKHSNLLCIARGLWNTGLGGAFLFVTVFGGAFGGFSTPQRWENGGKGKKTGKRARESYRWNP